VKNSCAGHRRPTDTMSNLCARDVLYAGVLAIYCSKQALSHTDAAAVCVIAHSLAHVCTQLIHL